MAVSASDEIRRLLGPRLPLPPHRPRERLGPNQKLLFGKLPMSIMCDSCGNRMPKRSMISTILDKSIVAQKGRCIGLTWTKMHHDCTNPNCLAEITIKRKGKEIVIESGATRYFGPEDEILDPPVLRIYQRNTASSGVVASSFSSVAATEDGEPQG